ncbi:MAG TPA: glycosyltransferase family 39 protein [Steroidobacter sp.]|nr:glycosyltransferase family 39 protein [Steroidobacteraceae bacterium]HLS83008.1 glycosyltransferase family 39 protein [Steroidobacter sp.]
MNTALERLLRPQAHGRRHERLDLCWLLGLGLLLIGAGVGLRDPWPPDEPRFALIARDMLASGEWLIPRVGADVYADKPPLFFWIEAALLWLTGSLRLAVFLPGLLAGLGTVVLVYDLARRLWSREIAFAAGLGLLLTVQFVWQARQGQIDATLCFFTTLSLYGLLRHLLLGPRWGWFVLGWAAAGVGVITKGVGFLPLAILPLHAVLRRMSPRAEDRAAASSVWGWAAGPLALAATVSLWLAPMLIAAANDPAIAAYRDEILYGQTVERYIDARHHHEPFWYFFVQVIPVLWAPLTALTPWLWRCWRLSWRRRDLRVLLPLLWAVLVVLFFSLSSGKRGVYVLPATPAFALACAPFLGELVRRRGPRLALFAATCAVAVLTLGAAAYALVDAQRRQWLLEAYGIDVVAPLLVIGLTIAVVCAMSGPRRGFAAYGAMLAGVLWIVGFWVNPAMNEARSGARFMRKVERLAADGAELGLLAYKEQYLLHITRPAVNFGHARWRERGQEADDAAAWLAQDGERMLLVDEFARERCFREATTREVGWSNRARWYLVSGEANPECAGRGDLSAAREYAPPSARRRSRAHE